MLDFDAICRGRTYFWRSLLFFDAWLWRYLSWPDILLEVIACRRCLTLTLFVVAGRTFGGHCFSSMLDSDAICRGRRYFGKSLLAFDAWFWCYMWCSRALGHFIVCIRCLILTLLVVAGHTFGGHCFSSMLDSDAICRGRRHFWKSLLAFDAWLWRYMWCSRALGHFIVCLRCLTLMLFVVFECTWRS